MVSCHCFACTGILRGSSAYRRSKAYCKCQPDNSSFYGCYIYCICARACGMQYHSGSGSVCYNSKGSVFTEGHNRRCRGKLSCCNAKGVARGIFSNEAGLGSAPIAAAAAQTKEPVRQGLVSMTGTFIDTIVICTLTGLSIVLTGAWQVDGLEVCRLLHTHSRMAFLYRKSYQHLYLCCVLYFCLYNYTRLGLL